ncbi:adenylate/guanylate cyclase domain-containing protein [Maridesulfovibrio sp.]|uniref:adenylate/guanylate cyclase domain-containing protein n=1 Tax=Maridesulfovibrio sp. TaxID=2795000 RepID=UPI003B004A4F
MRTPTQLNTAIIHADVVSYSKLDDRLKHELTNILERFTQTASEQFEIIIIKNTGDGFLLCLTDCTDACDIALQIRDFFRNTNWIKKGFNRAPEIRVGMHFGKIKRTQSLSDASGEAIVIAQRIEAITKPNSIFVSQPFNSIFEIDSDDRFSFYDLGNLELAKSYGLLHLYELTWGHESNRVQPTIENLYKPHPFIPQIPQRRTQSDKTHFSKQAYQAIFDLFSDWTTKTTQSDSRIEFKIAQVNEGMFITTMYFEGDFAEAVKIWEGSFYSENGITCSFGPIYDKYDTSSCNEQLSIEEDEGTLYLKALFATFTWGEECEFDPQKMTSTQAAEYLWKKLVKSLSYKNYS